MNDTPTFTRVYRVRLGFFVDSEELVVELARLIVDGEHIPLHRYGLAEAGIRFPWLAKTLRRLELELDASDRLRVPKNMVATMQKSGTSALQALSYGLGRCVEKNGITWFSRREEASVPYEYVDDGPAAGAIPSPWLFQLGDAEHLHGLATSKGGKSWLWPWKPTGIEEMTVQYSCDGNVCHAEVLVEDALGNIGCGAKAHRPKHPADILNAFRMAADRAMEDLLLMRHTVLLEVHEGPDKQRFLTTIGEGWRATVPNGFKSFGWQPGGEVSPSVKDKVESYFNRYNGYSFHIPGLKIEDITTTTIWQKKRTGSAFSLP